jgi:pimeloyl-ACP methyl ester carboxylesterase
MKMKMKMKHLLAATAGLVWATTPARAEIFVIVHGAFQTSQSWAQVGQNLKAKGHTVVAIDLPGRNTQGAEAKAVSIADYVNVVSAAVKNQTERVTLIGHSFGGITISMVGAANPEKIKRLVYVAAYIPISGESMQSIASGDKTNGFTEKSFVVSPDYSFATILEEDRARLFVNDGTPDLQKSATNAMVREPLGPIGTRVEIAAERFASVEKAYIRTTLDKTVSPPTQQMMIQRAGIRNVMELEAGHSPQLTQPAALADLIVTISK